MNEVQDIINDYLDDSYGLTVRLSKKQIAALVAFGDPKAQDFQSAKWAHFSTGAPGGGKGSQHWWEVNGRWVYDETASFASVTACNGHRLVRYSMSGATRCGGHDPALGNKIKHRAVSLPTMATLAKSIDHKGTLVFLFREGCTDDETGYKVLAIDDCGPDGAQLRFENSNVVSHPRPQPFDQVFDSHIGTTRPWMRGDLKVPSSVQRDMMPFGLDTSYLADIKKVAHARTMPLGHKDHMRVIWPDPTGPLSFAGSDHLCDNGCASKPSIRDVGLWTGMVMPVR